MIVDDNIFNIFTLDSLLKKFGIKSESASDGGDAIQKVMAKQKKGDNYDLIFMDCLMPIMDGFQV